MVKRRWLLLLLLMLLGAGTGGLWFFLGYRLSGDSIHYSVAPARLPVTAAALSPTVTVGEQSPVSGHIGAVRPPQLARLSPRLVRAMQEIRQPTPDEGKVIHHPDGSEEMDLGNRYRSIAIATYQPDGSVRVDYHGEKYLPEKPAVGAGDPGIDLQQVVP